MLRLHVISSAITTVQRRDSLSLSKEFFSSLLLLSSLYGSAPPPNFFLATSPSSPFAATVTLISLFFFYFFSLIPSLLLSLSHAWERSFSCAQANSLYPSSSLSWTRKKFSCAARELFLAMIPFLSASYFSLPVRCTFLSHRLLSSLPSSLSYFLLPFSHLLSWLLLLLPPLSWRMQNSFCTHECSQDTTLERKNFRI